MAADALTGAGGLGGDGAQQTELSPATAAKLFARLKLRLLRNSLRRGWQHAAALAASALMGIPAALGLSVLLALVLRRVPEANEAVVVTTFVALFAAWAVGPVMGFGTDETLDPSRLALLPLAPRHLLAGLFAASAIGVGPVATLLVLAGVIAGMAPPTPAAALTVVAVAVEFALCVTFGRAVVTALSRVLRSRRAQDLLIVVGALLAVSIALLAQLPNLLGDRLVRGDLRGLSRVVDLLGLTPPGLAGRAVLEARGGSLPLALAALLAAAAVVALLGWWWWRSLQQLTTRGDSASPRRVRGPGPAAIHPSGGPSDGPSGGATTAADRRRGLWLVDALFPRWAGFLPRSALGAVAAKELRYLLREPRLRANLVMVVVLAAAFPVVIALVDVLRHPAVVLGTVVLTWTASVNSLNAFGVDGRAFWIQAAAGTDARTELAGRNVGGALVPLALTTASAVAVAAVSGGWAFVPVAACAAFALLGVMYGLGNVVSVRFPQALPDSPTSVWSTSTTGTGCAAVVAQSVTMAVEFAALAPVAALVVVGLTVWPPALAVACPVALAEGVGVWLLGRNVAAGWLDAHQAELAQALSGPP